MSYDVSDFQREVIEASYEVPVLVDFWAPWCGPCRVLGPILEKLAGQSEGKWKLAKVNTDQEQELSLQYGIRGIPAGKLFANGDVVDEFTGALPEYAVAQWLEKALPSENKKRLAQAEMALAEGDASTAETLLRQVMNEEPGNPAARVLLAQLIVFDNPEEAANLVESAAFAGPGFVQTEEAVRTIARLHQLDEHPEQLPDGPGKETYQAGITALFRRDFDTALKLFIEVIQQNRYYDDDGARKACVALFTLLGEDDPATAKRRRLFNMVLY